VAGCPPDYFSPLGQLWGNPLYDWAAHAQEGYAWWIDRLRLNHRLFDITRIDHFRGFAAYWSIPGEAEDARDGDWVDGPGAAFFQAVSKELPDLRLIAEDLGTITPDVTELRDEVGLPGMAVLQFAFGGKADNWYLPHNLYPEQVVYTGTHDNDTTRGWYWSQPEAVRHHLRVYFGVSGDEVAWDLIRTAYRSVARLAIIPMQDLLSLGSEARLNAPGQALGNWQWRYTPPQLQQLGQSADYLRRLASLYGRTPEPESPPTGG
jgi:4-alpha-glucanotransferase